MALARLAIFIFIFNLPFASFAQLPSPASHLGFEIGADRKLADWKKITQYFEKLDQKSEAVQLVELGKSTEGRALVMAIITASSNFARMKDILRIQSQLSDPRRMRADSLTSFIQRGRAVVMITCSIHSTEIAASQMAMQLAYQLASANDGRTREILDNVVLLLVPSPNPDGVQMVVDWYEKYLDTPFEGTSPPWLYHPYAGHDNNRDWFMLNLVETQLVTRELYQKWFPQIVYDVHQMGRRGPRFVIPPFYEVSNPNIDPIILRSLMQIGGHMATDLTAAGFTGIATETTFDTWWHGGLRTAPYYHNMIGLLSEAASAKLATPVEIKFEELSGEARGLKSAREAQTNFPEPWRGGTWRMRDIINLELEACYSLLKLAARYREEWLRNFHLLGERALAKGRNEKPFAYVIPLAQKDPAAARKLLDILLQQGTEVLRAKESFIAEGAEFSAGTFVIDMAQPYRANVKNLFERQNYPKRQSYPGGPLERPYDVTGWTLPLQMGVEVITAETKFALVADTLRAAQLPARTFAPASSFASSSPFYLFSASSLDGYRLLKRLFKKGQEVYWNSEELQSFPAGQFIFSTTTIKPELLRELSEDLNVAVSPVEIGGAVAALRVREPRVALYRSYVPNADEGWTRYVLEQFEFDYQTVWDRDLRRGRLEKNFDALIFPAQNDSAILLGNSSTAQGEREAFPPEYCCGLGQTGLQHVRAFVENGGTLLAFDRAAKLFIKAWALPIVDELEGVKNSEFSAPGSLLMGLTEASHPVCYGLPREIALFFADSPVFNVRDRVGKTPLLYPQQNALLSGWLQGDEKLKGKAALVEYPLGKGRLLLFGFRPQHRGQTYGTFKLVFNSLLYSVAEPVRLGKSAQAVE